MNSNKNSITSMINILAPASLLSNYERHLLFFIIYFLFWISLALWFLKRTPYTQTLSISMLMVCIYTGLLAFGVGEDFDGSPTLAITPSDRSISNAVIINEEVKVYSGNSETFQVVFLIHDGAEIKTGEVRGKWVQVFLPEKQQGWLKKNTLDIL